MRVVGAGARVADKGDIEEILRRLDCLEAKLDSAAWEMMALRASMQRIIHRLTWAIAIAATAICAAEAGLLCAFWSR